MLFETSFAMLTGFPPFQSRTQDEIYKKVRSLTYTWPEESDCANYIPTEAKNLLSACLSLEEDARPEPDTIVDHEFFNMYPGCIPCELDRECRFSKPAWIRNQSPRGDRPETGYGLEYESRYLSRVSHVRNSEERYYICKDFLYTECGVGKKDSGVVRRTVGKRCSKSAFAECAAEEEFGMQPVIPLPMDQVYCYLQDEGDWSIQESRPEIEPRLSPVEDEEEQVQKVSSKAAAASLARTQLALEAQLRRKEAQPKSHAAMLRQQALPPRRPARENQLRNVQSGVHQVKDGVYRESVPVTTTTQNLLSERPIRCRAPGYQEPLREKTSTLSKSASVPSLMAGRTRAQSRQYLAALAEGKLNPMNPRSSVISDSIGSKQSTDDPVKKMPDQRSRKASSNVSEIPNSQPKMPLSSFNSVSDSRSRSRSDDATKSITSTVQTKTKSTFGVRPLIRASDDAEIMPGTGINAVMRDLKLYFSNLCRARSQGTSTLTRTRRRQQKPASTQPHSYVMKWVDYTNRYGIGYVLDDGSVGCVFKADRGCPASCVVVRDGERHIRRRARAQESSNPKNAYSEVDQLVPRTGQPVEFYENVDIDPRGRQGGEIKRVLVEAKGFDTDKYSTCELAAKVRTYDTEKLKRVKLVDQFGKYMIGSLGKSVEEPSPAADTLGNTFGQYVRFYQRLGNVGIWGFGDGAFQV